jgi:type III secretion protein Q
VSDRHSPIRDTLRRLDPGEAKLQSLLIASLNRRVVDRLRTRARLATERDRRAAGAWIRFDGRGRAVLVSPLLLDGDLAPMTTAGGEPDAASAAAALLRIEPVVATLERVLGTELFPAGLIREAPRENLFLRIDAHRDGGHGGQAHSRLIVALPSDLDVEPLEVGELEAQAMPSLHLRWRLRWAGPSLPVKRLQALARGDLILLGTSPLSARLALPGRNDMAVGRIDVAGRAYIVHEHAADHSLNSIEERRDEPIPSPVTGGAGPSVDLTGVSIPTVIELPGDGISTETLATLAPGTVLPLPSPGGTLAVRVLAGSTVVAQGELVAIGDGFGVLVTDVPLSSGD